MPASPNEFIRVVKNGFKFRMFLLYKLPAAFFSGVRVRDISERHCITSVPFKWLTQNPFRSTYFASLSMAAEMSTGVLGLAHIQNCTPPVSMLVVKVDSSYFKKAVKRTWFTCEDGEGIRAAIERAIESGEAQQFAAKSIGKNEGGDVIAEFVITWSFKAKSKNNRKKI